VANTFGNITKIPELRRRILFTLAMLAVYRVGVFVTVPGVNRVEMEHVITKRRLRLFPRHDQHVLRRRAGAALDLRPGHHALRLGVDRHPAPDRGRPQARPAQQGRRAGAGARSISYTRYGTILLAAIQGYFIAQFLEGLSTRGSEVVVDPGWAFRIMTMLTLTTGTAFIMWLGEQITERGIGNGSSMIIFAGIVAGDARRADPVPRAFGRRRPRQARQHHAASCW
jgi:preprotein translocase subunit SecY